MRFPTEGQKREWLARRRQVDALERTEGTETKVESYSAQENARFERERAEWLRRAVERDAFERGEILAVEVNEDGEGFALIRKGDGELARARVRMLAGRDDTPRRHRTEGS